MGTLSALVILARDALLTRVIMSGRHPLASRRVLTVADLQKETLLILAPEFQTRQLFEAACSSKQVTLALLLIRDLTATV